MATDYQNLFLDTVDQEHLCCAIADVKHQRGVQQKKQWLKERISEGHVFRKLDARGKVFIEYAPLETAWVPILGEKYLYIYCFWVSGSYAGQGHGSALLDYCLKDAHDRGKSGVCVLSSKTKKPFLSEKAFLLKHGFQVVDQVTGGYELLALSFDGSTPRFSDSVRQMHAESSILTIYYSVQCPYIAACIDEIQQYCQEASIPLRLIQVENLQQAKALPCVFNNFAVLYRNQFQTLQILNKNSLKKLLQRSEIG